MTQTLETLNQLFGLSGSLQFVTGRAGLPVAEIQTAQASAQVALHGAHLLAWQPTGAKPVIWLSKAAVFEAGKPVRGGIPVCWPWFGPRDSLPLHGFVRTRVWQVRQTSIDASGQVELRLGLVDDADTRAMWDFAFDLELVATIGTHLTMSLTTRNTGPQAFTLAQALHTYFDVGDIGQTTVQGLEGCTYLDKTQNLAQTTQMGVVDIVAETDRIYIDTTADCVIEDQNLARSIRVAKQGSTSTVVWNPWSEREKAIADMALGEHRHMLCVETCNAGPDQISVAPGATHTLTAVISVG